MPTLRCAAVLFDMDGVLVDSQAVVERVIKNWAKLRGIDPNPFLNAAHGRRTSDTMREIEPTLDIATEVAWLDAAEREDVEGIVAISGAADLLAALPGDRWAIVTSASREIAGLRLAAAGLPLPGKLVTSERVTRGKPAPDGYLLGAREVGAAPAACVVFEDAPPGVAAGKAAGMRVVGVATTFEPARLGSADLIVTDLRSVRVRETGPDIVLEISSLDT